MDLLWNSVQFFGSLVTLYVIIDWIRIHLGYKKVGK